MSAIAVQLGHLRVARGLTQQQLAERTGLRRDTISALERGKSRGIEFDTLARLCDALGCLPNDLLELGPTSHVAPILGGEDEDEIIAERIAAEDEDEIIAERIAAEDEDEIAALIANPSLALRYLTLEEDEPVRNVQPDDPGHPFALGVAVAETSPLDLGSTAIARRR